MKSEERTNNRVYIAIAFFIIITLILTIIFTTGDFTKAYAKDSTLVGGWTENPTERETTEKYLGLVQTNTYTYEIDQTKTNYPASLTVTTIKTPVMMTEKELREETINTISKKAEEKSIHLDKENKTIGERILKNNHQTKYVIFNGTNTSKNSSAKVKIIGEVWNCGKSGTSIVCIGTAQITMDDNISMTDTTQWEKIIGGVGKGKIKNITQPNALIYNIICH